MLKKGKGIRFSLTERQQFMIIEEDVKKNRRKAEEGIRHKIAYLLSTQEYKKAINLLDSIMSLINK